MVLTLYKLDASPPSRSAHMVLDLLGLEANYVDVNLIEGDQYTEEYRKRNPVTTIPTLDDDGFNIFESNAIAAYLVDKYAADDSLYPKDLQKRAVVNQRLLFNSSIVFPALRAATGEIIYKKKGKVSEERIEAIHNAYKLLEALLASTSGPWVAGDQLTIADICTMSTISSLDNVLAIDASKYPETDAWLKKCSELPTFQKINAPGNEMYKQVFNCMLD